MLLVVALATVEVAGEQALMVHVDLVNVHFTVCNKKGRLIPTLGRESFNVYEDDNPQVITNFSRETDQPLAIALLIDTSGSVRYKLRFEQEAAVEFLYTTLRRGQDKAAVFTFDSTIDKRQDYTDDAQLLANGVRRARSGGGTRLYDALHFLIKGTLAGREGCRGIIVLTDGDDNSSRSSSSEVVEAAQRHNVAIYAISVNSFGEQLNDSNRIDRVLETFAAETGGKAFFPTELKELVAHFKVISNELRSQYTIAYRSTNETRDGAFRRVRIDVKNAHYSVRSRTGYYAPSGLK